MKLRRLIALCALMTLLLPQRALGAAAADYDTACQELADGDYERASADFNALGKYEDAPELAMYSAAAASAAKGDYDTAVTALEQLGDFRDSRILALYYQGCWLESRQEYELAEKFFADNGLRLYGDVQSRLAKYPELIHDRDYAKAEALLAAGEYEAAYDAFAALAKVNFVSASKPDDELGYRIGTAAQQAGELATAYACYRELGLRYGGYSDSAARMNAIKDEGRYRLGLRDAEEEKYEAAYTLFAELQQDSDYSDSAEKAYLLGFRSRAEDMKKVGSGLIAYCFEGKWGIINLDTNKASNPYWDSIGSFRSVPISGEPVPVKLALVSRNGKYGYVDDHGDEHVKCQYDSVTPFNSLGLTMVSHDGKFGWLNAAVYTEGNQIVPVQFDAVSAFSANGYCKTAAAGGSGTLYGLYDQNGKEISEPVWAQIGVDDETGGITAPAFHMGRIQARNQDGKWTLLDTDGKTVGDLLWDKMGAFSDNQDPAKAADERVPVSLNGKGGYIGLDNTLKIGGFTDSDGELIAGSEAFIREKGHEPELIYEDVSAFSGGIAYVRLYEKFGYVDTDGNLMRSGFRFDTADSYDGTYAAVGIWDEDDTANRGFWLISGDSRKSLFRSIADDKNTYAEAVSLQEKAEKMGGLDPEKESLYEQALEKFDSLNGYEDSFDRVKQCEDWLYAYALRLRGEGTDDAENFTEPLRILTLLGDTYHYYDAKKQARVTYYRWGLEKRAAGDWDGARSCFEKGGDFNPAAETDQETLAYIEAASGYDAEEDRLSCAAQISRTWYLEGLDERAARNWDMARNSFGSAGDYAPVHDPEDPEPAGEGLSGTAQVSKSWYMQGLLEARPQLSWDDARVCFLNAGNYDPNQEACAEYADDDPLGETENGLLNARQQIQETYFQQAWAVRHGYAAWDESLAVSRDLVEAHRLYTRNIIGYTGGYRLNSAFVDTIILTDTEMTSAVRKAWTTAGNEVKLGTYEQDGAESAGQEDIRWIVLDTRDGDSLILSVYGLEPMAFYSRQKAVTWAESIPREWLEKEFFPAAFSTDEQKAVRLTQVSNSKRQNNPAYYGMKGSPDTFDRLFLLSYAEVLHYLPEEEDRAAEATLYAQDKGAYTSDGGNCWWWLRNPGSRKDTASGVVADGKFDRNYVNTARNCVRPACWVDVESVIYPASLTWPDRLVNPADAPAARHELETDDGTDSTYFEDDSGRGGPGLQKK